MRLLSRWVTEIRVACGLSLVLVVSLLFEAWMRLVFVPWRRRGSESWHRAWNGIVRTWGVWNTEIARTFLDLKIEVEGTVPASGRFLVVANHQSSFDVPFLIHVLRRLDLKFVAHSGLATGKPFVSLCLRHGGMAVVDKLEACDDLLRIRAFAWRLASWRGSPMIFPEGIRTFDGTIGPLYFAGTHALQGGAGLPVLPVILDGLWHARSIGETHRLAGATVRFRVLDPIPAERFATNPRVAYREVEEAIREGLASLRGVSVETPEREAVGV